MLFSIKISRYIGYMTDMVVESSKYTYGYEWVRACEQNKIIGFIDVLVLYCTDDLRLSIYQYWVIIIIIDQLNYFRSYIYLCVCLDHKLALDKL